MTTRDAGGPLEVVVDRENGHRLRAASPPAVAAACSWLAAHPDEARAHGPRRQANAPSGVTWDAVVDRLLGS